MNFTAEHKTNNLILRFIANQVFHPLSMVFFTMGLKYNEKLPLTLPNMAMETLGFRLYKILDIPYSKWGTLYKLDLSSFDLDDGLGWDDYDEHGIPYWDYLWHEDPITGDAWRIHAKK
jgi:hypothetical protein